jgi:hypothetical protein
MNFQTASASLLPQKLAHGRIFTEANGARVSSLGLVEALHALQQMRGKCPVRLVVFNVSVWCSPLAPEGA